MAAIDDLLRAWGLAPQNITDPNVQRPFLPGGTPTGTQPFLPPGTPTGLQPTLPPGTPVPPGRPGPTAITDPVPMGGNPPRLDQHFGTGNNPYGDFNRKFGGAKNMYDTGVSKKLGEQNPIFEWTRWSGLSGFGGNNRKGAFGQNQFGKFNNAFGAALLNRPDLSLREFAKQTDPMKALNTEWLRASANARGARPASRSQVVRLG